MTPPSHLSPTFFPFLFWLTVLLLLCSNLTHGLITEVDPHKEECFYKDLEKDSSITFEFQVMSGGALDIDVLLSGPDGKTIYSESKESEGEYMFNTESDGFYRFCFSNKMSTLTSKLISFNILDEEELISRPVKPEDIDPLENAILQLSDGLHTIQAENKYMKLRERAHRNTSESTNSRVLWTSILEWAVLCGMSLWQIYYLRSFFEVRRSV